MLLARSFHVNLRALDAMVQSKRAGGTLRGFDEVAAQMRSWSRDLHRELERLGELGRQVVAQTSLAVKQEHSLRLLTQAAVASGRSDVAQICAERREQHEALDQELNRAWRNVRELLHDLEQLGMMAAVLSRSAMIEAASGSEQHRAQLAEVSREFYANSQDVIDTLQATAKIARGDQT